MLDNINIENITLKNIIILNKPLNKRFFNINNLKRYTKEKSIEYIEKINNILNNNIIIGINYRNFSTYNYNLLKEIIEWVNNEKYINTYKLNLYFYNLDKSSNEVIKNILEYLEYYSIPYNVFLLFKEKTENIQFLIHKILFYTKFIHVPKNMNINIFDNKNIKLIKNNKLFNIYTNLKYKNIYTLGKMTKYNTKTYINNSFFDKYPIVYDYIKNNINPYIYISLNSKKNLNIINKYLYNFTTENEKELYKTIFQVLIYNMNELINYKNIENINFLIFDYIKTIKEIKNSEIKKLVNKLEFFNIMDNIKSKIIHYLNYYNIDILTVPNIKTFSYIEFK